METHYHRLEQLEDRLLLAAAPVVDSTSFIRANDSRVSGVVVNFSEDLSFSLDNTDLVLFNEDTQEFVSTAESELLVINNVATWTFQNLTGGKLPDGSYTATLMAIGIFNTQLQFLDGNGDGTGGDNYEFVFDSIGSASVSGNIFSDVNSDAALSLLVDQPMDSWRVYIDDNSNDSFDEGESYVLSDSDGGWLISGLEPGDYRIIVELPVGFECVTPASGNFQLALDSDQQLSGYDFIVQRPDSISGIIYQDLNSNGQRDSGEDGIAGWNVYMDENSNLQYDVGERIAVTDSDGRYYFDSVDSGSHLITAIAGDNWTIGSPAGGSYMAALVAGGAVDHCNFGALAGASSISGTIFEDIDGDGIFDAGESPLSGWAVFIDADGDGNFDFDETWTVTDAQGQYIFEDVEPGDYIIAAAMQNGWDATTPVGTLGGEVSFVQVLSADTPGLGEFDRSSMTAVSPDGAHVYVAARGSGTWSLYSFAVSAADSRLTLVQQISENDIDVVNTASDIIFSPDGSFVYVVASNNAAIGVFSRNIATGELSYVETVESAYLAGGSAAAMTTDGEYMYVSASTSSSVLVYSRNALTGRLTELQVCRDGQLGADSLGGAADILISPDARHVYAASALDEAIAIFSRNPSDGTLSYIGSMDEGASVAASMGYLSSIAISPDGEYLYSVAAGDACMSVYWRDESTGLLTFDEVFRDSSGGVNGIDYPTHVTVSEDGKQILVAGSVGYAFAEFARSGDSHSYVTAIEDDYTDTIIPDRRTVQFAPNGRTIYLSGMPGSTVMVYEYSVRDAHLAELDPGEVISNLNFGFASQDSSVAGTVWLDADGDGIKDAGEPGISGWTVRLELGNSTWTVQTDAAGNYSFGGLGSGVHVVKLDLPDGWINTYPGGAAQLVTLSVGQDLGNINFAAMIPGGISGHVFEDADRDGINDIGEGGLSNVTVYIDSNTNGVADAGEPQVFSDSQGNFVFDNLTAGTYRISVVFEDGLIASSPVGGAYTVTIANGQSVSGYEFGAYRLGTISGTVWQDANGDTVIDDDEIPLQGWEVYVDIDGDGFQDASEPVKTSDADGYYEFTNLVPANYIVRLVVQNGWRTISTIGDSQTVAITSGSSATSTNFALAQPVTISGMLWHDTNGDGITDDTEVPLAGWRVFLDVDGDGLLDSGETEAVTDEFGVYTFTEADPGPHNIAVSIPAGWWATLPTSGTDSIVAASGSVITDVNFGFRPGENFDSSGKLKYTDPSGVTIVVNVNRNISGRLYFDQDGYVSELAVIAGDDRGDIYVNVANSPGTFLIGSVLLGGAVRNFVAPDLGIDGGEFAAGSMLNSLVLGDVQNAEITLPLGLPGAIATPVNMKFGHLKDVIIDCGVLPVNSFIATEWLDTDAEADMLTAESISQLVITGQGGNIPEFTSDGDMQADMLIGTDGVISDDAVLDKVDIAGDVSGTWDVFGGMGKLNIPGGASDWTVNATGGAILLNAGVVQQADLNFSAAVENVKAQQWLAGSLAAAAIGDMQITGDRRNDIAGDFGADIAISALSAVIGDYAARRLQIAGDVTSTQWDIAGTVRDIVVGGDLSDLALTLGGSIDSISGGIFTNVAIDATGQIGRLTGLEYTGGSITADSLNELKITGDRRNEIAGDFMADITLTGENLIEGQPVAKKMSIAGSASGAVWDMTGDVDSVNIIGDASSLDIQLQGDLGRFDADSVSDTALDVSGRFDQLTATQWAGGSVSADSMKLIKISGDRKREIAGDFTGNLTLAGQNISDGDDVIRQIVISGDVDSSSWEITGDVLLILIGGDASNWTLVLASELGSLHLGDASDSSVQVNGPVGKIITESWLGGAIEAASIGSITIGSKLTADQDVCQLDITLSDQDQALGKANIVGNIANCQWDMTGGYVGPVNILGSANSFILTADDVRSFSADLVTDSSIDSTGQLGPVKAGQWAGGAIVADSLNSLKITGNKKTDIAGDFDADITLAGQNVDRGNTCGGINIAGSVSDANWSISGDSGNIIIGESTENFSFVSDGQVGKINVVGSAVGMRLVSSGSVTSIQLGACIGSDFLIGVDIDFEDRHVSHAGDFTNGLAAVNLVEISGIKDPESGISRFVSDSNFSAPFIKQARVRNTDDAAEPVTFYVVNDGPQSKLVKYYDTEQRSGWKWDPTSRKAQPDQGNIVWHPVGDAYRPVLSAGALTINEGGQATFTIKLSADPIVATTVDISWVAGEQDIQISGSSQLNFNSGNWNQPQTVTLISGEDSDVLNGWTDFEIAASGGSATASLRVTENDDDQPFSLVLSSPTLDVTEGSVGQVSLSLSSAPLGPVVVSVAYSSGDSDINVIFGSMLVFDWSNWNTPQVILFNAILDADALNGSAIFTISALGAESDLTLTVNEVDIDA